MLLDIARQMRRLGIQPRRTIRFALFNGEEQGMFGSWAYTRAHRDELDRHVMASSYDVGSGRINGFFTNGRPALLPLVEGALGAVGELGPFTQLDAPIVGTDNFDFMLEGVPNVVANQESANYGPSYHSRADTFDKVDLRQLRLNAAVAASVTWAFAEMDAALPRQSRAEVEALFKNSDLEAQMRGMGVWKDWAEGHRGRAK
jgi:carboxypeptidase Q